MKKFVIERQIEQLKISSDNIDKSPKNTLKILCPYVIRPAATIYDISSSFIQMTTHFWTRKAERSKLLAIGSVPLRRKRQV
uniref:Uncharacterized protein n=1 Tax=Romanomermis culicivorax TaxID=13658 RepID=A0A915HRA7_ROMCU